MQKRSSDGKAHDDNGHGPVLHNDGVLHLKMTVGIESLAFAITGV